MFHHYAGKDYYEAKERVDEAKLKIVYWGAVSPFAIWPEWETDNSVKQKEREDAGKQLQAIISASSIKKIEFIVLTINVGSAIVIVAIFIIGGILQSIREVEEHYGITRF